jgi:four helix bundle protein
MKHTTLLEEKSFSFALRIIKLNRYLQDDHKEYVISKQILRSGTAIGALIRESKYAQSKADFLHKQMIALKEASETEYWLYLLKESEYISLKMFHSISPQMTEILKLLVASTKKTKSTLSQG